MSSNDKLKVYIYKIGTKDDLRLLDKSLNLDEIVEIVNSLQDCFEVVNGGKIEFSEDEMTQISTGCLGNCDIYDIMLSKNKNASKDHQEPPTILITSRYLSGNLFSYEIDNFTVVTCYDWDYFSPPDFEVYVVRQIVRRILFSCCDNISDHQETRGCVMDYCERKLDIKYGLITGDFCEICKRDIENCMEEGKLTKKQFECLTKILKWISSETKKQIWHFITHSKGTYDFYREVREILRFHFIKQGYNVEFEKRLLDYTLHLVAEKNGEVIAVVIVEPQVLENSTLIGLLKEIKFEVEKQQNWRFYIATIGDHDKLKELANKHSLSFIQIDEKLNLNYIEHRLQRKDIRKYDYLSEYLSLYIASLYHDVYDIPYILSFKEAIKNYKEVLSISAPTVVLKSLEDRKLIPNNLIQTVYSRLKSSEISYKDKVSKFYNDFMNDFTRDIYDLIHDTVIDLLDRETDLFRLFRDFEKLLYESKSFYRDHYIHPFQVFLIGLLIVDALYDELIQIIRKQFDLSEDEAKRVIDYTWLYSSLFHDIGYPLQKFKEWSQEFMKKFLGYDLSINIDLTKSFITQQDSYTILHYVDMLSELYNKLTGQTTTEFRDLFLNEFLERQNHATTSALALMKIHENILKSDDEKHKVEKIIVKLSALSIALHDRKLFLKLTHPIKFEELPFAFILIFSDTAQEWGRPLELRKFEDDDITFEIKEINSNKIHIILKYKNRERMKDKYKECLDVENKIKDQLKRFIITLTDDRIENTIRF